MALVRAMFWLLLAPLAMAHPMTPVTTTPATTTSHHHLRQVSCDPAAQSCWSQGQLPLADGAWRCAEPLSQGPCRTGEWFTLDHTSADAQLRGRCARRPCSDAQLPWDGRCLSERALRVALCGGRAVHLDPTGNPRCGDFPGWTSALAALALCVETQPSTTSVAVGGVDCAQNDRGHCASGVVVSTSRVVIEPEDE